MTDFNTVSGKRRMASESWNKQVLREKFGRDDVLPFWVADMEFAAPPSVRAALAERVENGIFGYECRPDSLFEAITNWHSRRHGWIFDRDELCFTRGTINIISMLLNLYTSESDGVIVQPPVYFEFQRAITDNHRKVISNPLTCVRGRYEMDFEDLENKAAEPRTKILILCNPHNPVGRVWETHELQRLADICLKHDVLVVSDEVHGDFVFSGHSFTPFASISSDAASNSFICLSPSKTFNLPAITDSYVVIPNSHFRADFVRSTKQLSMDKINTFSAVATETAYRSADKWLAQAIEYVEKNVSDLRNALRTRIPRVQLIRAEGTYLAWIDFRELGLEAEQLETFLAQRARLALKSGHSFGQEGTGFARMTIACPQTMLDEGISRLEYAVNSISR